MGIPRPTGEYAGQMLEPGGWPESNEDTFYDRAEEYKGVLRKVTDVMDATRHQQVEVFEGGVWSGGAANAANGALGTNVKEMGTLQDYLATVITWHQHVAGLIVQAKSEIGNNVDGAQRDISILENDQDLDADERQLAINALVRETHAANSSLVTETAELVRASKDWKPPHNALADLLHQVTPPTPEIPTVDGPSTPRPTPVYPTPTPFEPTPGTPVTPVNPRPPVTPVTPTPVTPGTPGIPVTPITPVNPVTPGTPGIPVTPITPINPTPDKPVTPVNPITPIKPKPDEPAITPVNPAPAPVNPTPAPAPVNPTPAPVNPAPAVEPSPAPAPAPAPSPNQPSVPGDPGTSTPGGPSTDPAHVKPAAATDVPAAPSHQGAPGGGQSRGDDASAGMAPAAAGGMPAGGRGPGGGSIGSAASAGASPSAGTAAGSGAGSRAAGGRAPLGPSGKAPATASTRAASARTAPPTRPGPPPERPDDSDKDKKDSADNMMPGGSVPVSAARAARDAVLSAARRSTKDESLRLARRIAAALNASDIANADDFGFFWITAVTTDGEIVVANSYGLAYIPDGVDLPAKVFFASADRAMPADEKARTATYPILAVQGWAAYHDLKLRAVFGTAEQLANSDPGATKIVLEDDDIPESGAKMTGRSRLEVVDPSAATQLAETDDVRLIDLLPPAPAAEDPPDDERHMFWFELMKPMTSSASGREVAHLRAFHAYAAHSQELALHAAHSATDPEAQRPAVADYLYWRYVAELLNSALTEAP